jgi:predicted Zn-dependent protease
MIRARRFYLATALLVAALWAHPALGAPHPSPSYTLDLIGVRWAPDHTAVTYFIKAGQGVTTQAKNAVLDAISLWNGALSGVNGAPSLVPAGSANAADILIQMKVGGGVVLGQALWHLASPFSCYIGSATVQLSGKAFGQPFTSAAVTNTALQELGHTLGLGHGTDPNDVMYPYGDPQASSVLSISACDIEGLHYIYDPASQYGSDPCDIPSSIPCS